MAQKAVKSSGAQSIGASRIFVWLIGLGSFGLLVYLVVGSVMQIVIPPPAHRLVFVQDIPLPSVLPNEFLPDVRTVPKDQGPLTPGVSVRFDHFDFQTLDPNTHLLFMAHTGPAPDKFSLINHIQPDKFSQVDGNVLVFDTRQNKLVGRVDIPQIAGIVAAPDLGKVYAADSNADDKTVYVIDERTLKAAPIQVGDNATPDAIEYDQDDHKVFVSNPGNPDPNTGNIDPNNQNIIVIDTQTNKVTKINLGHLPLLPGEHPELSKFGYDVGHNRYDPVLHRLFVTTGQLTDQSVQNPAQPPGGTGELVSIDPVTQKVLDRLQLPKTCGIPHGMVIDAAQNTAFIVCMELDPDQGLVQNLVRVNVQSMRVIPGPLMLLAPKPDIVALDSKFHVVMVGCAGGVSVFDERNGNLKKLGDYILAKNTHTILIDETTQLVYMPQADAGGRPTLRIAKYNPNGA